MKWNYKISHQMFKGILIRVPQPGRWADWKMALAAQSPSSQVLGDQSVGQSAAEPCHHFSLCWGGPGSRTACRGVWGGPKNLEHGWTDLPRDVKAGLIRNGFAQGRERTSQTFLKQDLHKHSHPSLMHKASADPYSFSDINMLSKLL